MTVRSGADRDHEVVIGFSAVRGLALKMINSYALRLGHFRLKGCAFEFRFPPTLPTTNSFSRSSGSPHENPVCGTSRAPHAGSSLHKT